MPRALTARPQTQTLLTHLQTHYEALRNLRRGVCLLNAGRFEQAAESLGRAAAFGCIDRSLPSYLAACLIGQGRHPEAADQLARLTGEDRERTVAQIRRGLSLSAAGRPAEAIDVLRQAIRSNPECAELHFQLGTLLTSCERYDEAGLRFTQAINIDREHTEALVSLALCCGLRGAPGEALIHLQQAQRRRPHDARIGLLLARAAKAEQQQGGAPRVYATMPADDPRANRRGIDELSRVIEAEPDFVDAFLSLPESAIDQEVFAMLLGTVQAALERQPEHAELHFHCGRVLQRLGRHQDAIDAGERAVEIDPRFTRALIELGKLYQQTDQTADAVTRLEHAIAAGAEYADVYFLLGNLYRDRGEIGRARQAYRRALRINNRYEAAQQALAALAS